MGKGSLRASIFSLSASAIGSAVLNLPYLLNLNGYVLGVFFLVLGSISSEWSLRILAYLATEHDLPNYSQIAIAAGGERLQSILTWSIVLMMFGACISYQIICASLLRYALIELDFDAEMVSSSEFNAILSSFFAVFVILPLCF